MTAEAIVKAVTDALGEDALQGVRNGAIYMLVKVHARSYIKALTRIQLPMTKMDDVAVVKYLAEEHGVCVIPGSACGAPGKPKHALWLFILI